MVTLNRPDRLNALSIDLAVALDRMLSAIAAENDTWVVVLTGAGRGFCSGLDLKDYGVLPGIDGLTVGRIAQRSMRAYSRIVLTMRRIPQPIVAAVTTRSGYELHLAGGRKLVVEAVESTDAGREFGRQIEEAAAHAGMQVIG